MATYYTWNPFGVALEIAASGASVVRKSATQFTVTVTAEWKTYYSGAKTNYGMDATSGGTTTTISSFGTSRSSGSTTFTGTYSISGNGAATKTITVTFKNYNTDNGKSATKNVTFNVAVPAWTSYVIKYNANGGTGAPGNQTKWKDQTLTLSGTKPTRTGYSFLGWATAAWSTTATYSAGGSYTANAAATLYAVWKANTYTVKYNANGGTGAPGNQTKTYGQTLKLSTTTPTRTNYNFKGWATSASATTATYASGANYTNNAGVTLYAVWELAYVKPTLKNVVVERCDQNGIVTDDGTYAKVSFDWTTFKTATSASIEWPVGEIEEYNEIAKAVEVNSFDELKAYNGVALLKNYRHEYSSVISNTQYDVIKIPVQSGDIIRDMLATRWAKSSTNTSWYYAFYYNANGQLTSPNRLSVSYAEHANNNYLDIRENGISVPEGCAYLIINIYQTYWNPSDDKSFTNGKNANIITKNKDASLTVYNGTAGLSDYIPTSEQTGLLNIALSGTSGTVLQTIGDDRLNLNITYPITISITDAGGTTTISKTLSGFRFPIDVLNGEVGVGVSIGKPAEKKDTFDVDLNTEFQKPINIKQNRYSYSSTGTSGETGYIRMASISIISTSANWPVTFIFNRRKALTPMTVHMTLENSTETDSTLSTFVYEGTNYGAFLVQTSPLVWDLFVQKANNNDTITLQDWYTSTNMDKRISVTFPGDLVSTVPTPYHRAVPAQVRAILDYIYPVGSIYISYSHVDPGTMFGGTWTRLVNTFLWGCDADGDIGVTGGEKTHTLTTAELPSHTHGAVYSGNVPDGTSKNLPWLSTGTLGTGDKIGYAQIATGGGAAHNNMPPYTQVAIWRRTS